MELRVWVDGTQRVVCGVKLTTTCQEIVFALAHAIQQAGRFTMIERWGNNERLLSPNEQPLVTLQRYGDRMNEVEFILRKTSTDYNSHLQHTQTQQRQIQPQQQKIQNGAKRDQNEIDDQINQLLNNSGHRDSPISSGSKTSSQQHLNDKIPENTNPHQMYNLNRRPQTVLGSITGSNSSMAMNSRYLSDNPYTLNSMMSNFRSSTSVSTLPEIGNGISKTNSSVMLPASRIHYADDQELNSNASSVMRHSHNGYSMNSEILPSNLTNDLSNQISKNYPFEDLYSTVNKKQSIQPPAVPAKPRVMNPYATNLSLPHQQHPNLHNGQLKYNFQQNRSPIGMYANNIVRPRQPPGYMEYIGAMSNRNSLPQPMLSNSVYTRASACPTQSNIYPRPHDGQQVHKMQVNGSSPVSPSLVPNNGVRHVVPRSITGNIQPPVSRLHRYSYNGQSNIEDPDDGAQAVLSNSRLPSSRTSDQSVPINRQVATGPSVTGTETSNESSSSTTARLSSNHLSENMLQSLNGSSSSNVSQIGHDMLKVIEEQKKVLLNQKNELDLLDNDCEYWETKQNSEQVELINRIEKEIEQLEELWKENQVQIKRLENQDLEKELHALKSEQSKMRSEIEKQKRKLSRCEDDIVMCKKKIEQLEFEIQKKDVLHSVADDDLPGDIEVGKLGETIKSLNVGTDVDSAIENGDDGKPTSLPHDSSNGIEALSGRSGSVPVPTITPPSSTASPVSSKDDEHTIESKFNQIELIQQSSKINSIDSSSQDDVPIGNNNNNATKNGSPNTNNQISQLRTIETI